MNQHDGRDDPRGLGEIVRGLDGRPLVDRFGRPVRRRLDPAQVQQQQAPQQSRTQQQMPPPREVPRRISQQHFNAPAQPRPPAARSRRRRMRRPGCLGFLGRVVVIVLVLAVALTLWADTQLNRVDATPAPRAADTAGTNWLLVGTDSRQGLTEEDIDRLGTGGDIGIARTDTIMLLHIPTGGQARLVSIPRDSLVSIPGYGENKINAAFTFGGPTLLTSTVEQTTGLRIDHYAEIGMGGLANVVDAVGGVELCPEYPINDPLANLNVVAGCQEMDGPTSLGYVRTRATPQGDLDRVERQRDFFAALIGQMTSPATLINPFRMFPMVTSTANSFTVGDGDHVWHLARVAFTMRSGINTETVPVAGFADYAVGNVVLWDQAGTQALWDSMK